MSLLERGKYIRNYTKNINRFIPKIIILWVLYCRLLLIPYRYNFSSVKFKWVNITKPGIYFLFMHIFFSKMLFSSLDAMFTLSKKTTTAPIWLHHTVYGKRNKVFAIIKYHINKSLEMFLLLGYFSKYVYTFVQYFPNGKGSENVYFVTNRSLFVKGSRKIVIFLVDIH